MNKIEEKKKQQTNKKLLLLLVVVFNAVALDGQSEKQENVEGLQNNTRGATHATKYNTSFRTLSTPKL